MMRHQNRVKTHVNSLSPIKMRSPLICRVQQRKTFQAVNSSFGQFSPLRKNKRCTTDALKNGKMHDSADSSFCQGILSTQKKSPIAHRTKSPLKKVNFQYSDVPNFIKAKKSKNVTIILTGNENGYNSSAEQIYECKTKLDNFQIGQMLGKGANGTVNVVRHKKTGFFFAMKKISKQKVLKNLPRFIASIKIQMFADNPNISKLYQVFPEGQQIVLIMQLCVDGDLTCRIKDIRKKQNLKQVIRGIVKGLKYLHQHKILHRDLKLQNILVCHDMPKITDFDLAVYQQNLLQSRKTFCGSPAYFSPQMLTKTSYNSKVDIWCLGILCYQLVCGYFPFQIKNIQQLENIVSKPIKEFPPQIDPAIKDFINISLKKNPQQRAGWKQILTHPILKSDS